MARGRCRRGTSQARQRKRPLADSLGGEAQRFVNVISSKVRVRLEYFCFRHAVCNGSNDSRDRDAQAANAGHAAHLIRVHCDARELHLLSNDIVAISYLRSATALGTLTNGLAETSAQRSPPCFDDKPREKRTVKRATMWRCSQLSTST